MKLKSSDRRVVMRCGRGEDEHATMGPKSFWCDLALVQALLAISRNENPNHEILINKGRGFDIFLLLAKIL